MGVRESAALRNVRPWSLAYRLSPVYRDAFFFYSFWWHREKRGWVLEPKWPGFDFVLLLYSSVILGTLLLPIVKWGKNILTL